MSRGDEVMRLRLGEGNDPKITRDLSSVNHMIHFHTHTYTLRVQAAVDPNLPRRRFHKPNPSHAFLYPMQAVTPNDNTGQ